MEFAVLRRDEDTDRLKPLPLPVLELPLLPIFIAAAVSFSLLRPNTMEPWSDLLPVVLRRGEEPLRESGDILDSVGTDWLNRRVGINPRLADRLRAGRRRVLLPTSWMFLLAFSSGDEQLKGLLLPALSRLGSGEQGAGYVETARSLSPGLETASLSFRNFGPFL